MACVACNKLPKDFYDYCESKGLNSRLMTSKLIYQEGAVKYDLIEPAQFLLKYGYLGSDTTDCCRDAGHRIYLSQKAGINKLKSPELLKVVVENVKTSLEILQGMSKAVRIKLTYYLPEQIKGYMLDMEEFLNITGIETEALEESCTSGEFQRAAPRRKLKTVTNIKKKSLGKKDKYNTLGENMKNRKLHEDCEQAKEIIVAYLEDMVQKTCPELKGCLDSYIDSLQDGEFECDQYIESTEELEIYFEDFLEYARTILDGAENYFNANL